MAVPGAEASDDELAAAAAAGDDRAFEQLVERYQGRVYRLACRLSSEADAPDILQDTFLQVYRHLPSFRGDSQVGTWIYRIATNASLMHQRARARRPAEPLDEFMPRFDECGALAATPAELLTMTGIEERLDRETLAGHARAAIARLPALYREAFVLRDLEELSTAEVAASLGIDPATVRQRVHRARLMLRGFLQCLVKVQA